MSIIAKENERDFPELPVGNYQAVCYAVWDIGLREAEWKGKKYFAHKIIIGWEVTERITSAGDYNGKRYAINAWYTLSLGEKANLRKHLTSWRGKEFTKEELKAFDIENLIGANCLLNIIHNEKGKPKVAAVTPLISGVPKILPDASKDTPKWVKKFQDEAVSPERAAEILDQAHEAESNGQEEPNETEIPF